MYDVIIVGAGPAGSTCARECAKGGLAALLVDKAVFPRSKPCAGAVSERALATLDFYLPREIIERECYGATIHMKGQAVEIRKERRIAVLVSREKFDAFLVDQAIRAGARFHPGEEVLDVEAHRDFVEVKTGKSAYRASCLIGADGVHSTVARLLRPPFGKDETAFALVCSVPADGAERDGDGLLGMYFGMVSMGYGWIFPHAGYYSVGIMARASGFSDPVNVFMDFARSLGVRPANLRGHFIPYGGIKRRIRSGRILLAGDAAGFADPFHGEGISYAVLSGKLAARAVADALRGRDGPAALASYEREADRLLRKNLRGALRMARLINRFPDLSLRIFLDNKKTLEKYLDIAAGRIDYARFWRWFLLRAPFYLISSYYRDIFNPRAKRAGPAGTGPGTRDTSRAS